MDQDRTEVAVTADEERLLRAFREFADDETRHLREDADFLELVEDAPAPEPESDVVAKTMPFPDHWTRAAIGLRGMVLGGLAADAFAGTENPSAQAPLGPTSAISRRLLLFAEAMTRAHANLHLRGPNDAEGLLRDAYRRWLAVESQQPAESPLTADPAMLRAHPADPAFTADCRAAVDRTGPADSDGRSAASEVLAHAAPLVAAWDRRVDPKMQEVLPGFGRMLASLTHASPEETLACGSLLVLLRLSRSPQPLFRNVVLHSQYLTAFPGRERVEEVLHRAVDIGHAHPDSPEAAVSELAESVDPSSALGALAIGTLAALYGETRPSATRFADALSIAVAHRGARAASAAVCGQLLGMYNGPGIIPRPWIEQLDLATTASGVITDLLAAVGPLPPRSEEWTARYADGPTLPTPQEPPETSAQPEHEAPAASLIDHGMREAMAGRLEQDRFLTVVASAVLPVVVDDGGDLMLFDDERGPCLVTYAAETLVPEGVRTEPMYLPRAVRVLPSEASVVLNGSGGLQARYPVADLVATMREKQLLVDLPEGGFDVGPQIWVEQRTRLTDILDEPAFLEVERALARWSTLDRPTQEGARTVILGIEAVEVLVQCGVTNRDVLAAAAAFHGVDPRYGRPRELVTKMPDEGLVPAMLLKAATSPAVPDGVEPDRERIALQQYVAHLHAMPWQVRAIVLANRVADVTSRYLHPDLREDRRRDLAGPLLTCVRGVPEGLRRRAADLVGANPAAPELSEVPQPPAPVITSEAQALDRVRREIGPAEPLESADLGPAYAVRSQNRPGEVHLVHKVWDTVTTTLDDDAAVEDFCAGCALFPLAPSVLPQDHIGDANLRAPSVLGTGADVQQRGQRFRGAVLGFAIGHHLGAPVAELTAEEIRHRHGERGIEHYAPAAGPDRLRAGVLRLALSLDIVTRAADESPDADPGRLLDAGFAEAAQHLPEHRNQVIAQAIAHLGVDTGCAEALAHPQPGAVEIGRYLPLLLRTEVSSRLFALVQQAASAAGAAEAASIAGFVVMLQQCITTHNPGRAITTAESLEAPDFPLPALLDQATSLARPGITPAEVERLGSGRTAAEAVAIAVCAAESAGWSDFDEALRIAVNHSGNSAVTGAVCGALMGGSFAGVEGIPARWIDKTLTGGHLLFQLAEHACERFAPDARGSADTPASPEPHRPVPTPADRFLGSMLAGALGDALGFAVEFFGMDAIRQVYGEDGIRDLVLREGVAVFSDDTQMMLFTLEGLIRAHVARRIEPSDNDPMPEVQHAYQRWYFTQQTQTWQDAAGPYARHLSGPDGWLVTNRGLFAQRAPGGTCMRALENFARTHRHATPQHRINDSKGCGGVMRAAPVAVWSNDPAEVFWAAAGTGALTHSHPSGYLSAGVLAVLVHQLIREVPLREAVRLARELLVRWPGHEEQLRAMDAAVELAGRGRVSPEELQEHLGGGWVGEEALAIGLYAVLATGSLREALVLSVNHSGDSDSTGIVCGNIAGALYGPEALPPEWLQSLELRDVIETLTADALTEFSPNPPTDPAWTRRYPAW